MVACLIVVQEKRLSNQNCQTQDDSLVSLL